MPSELAALRLQLDALDDELVRLLHRRATLVSQVWALKQQRGLAQTDPDREHAMHGRLLRLGESLGLAPGRVQAVLRHVIGVDLTR